MITFEEIKKEKEGLIKDKIRLHEKLIIEAEQKNFHSEANAYKEVIAHYETLLNNQDETTLGYITMYTNWTLTFIEQFAKKWYDAKFRGEKNKTNFVKNFISEYNRTGYPYYNKLSLDENEIEKLLELCENSNKLTNEARDYLVNLVNSTYGTKIPLSKELYEAETVIENNINNNIAMRQAHMTLFYAGKHLKYGSVPQLKTQMNKWIDDCFPLSKEEIQKANFKKAKEKTKTEIINKIKINEENLTRSTNESTKNFLINNLKQIEKLLNNLDEATRSYISMKTNEAIKYIELRLPYFINQEKTVKLEDFMKPIRGEMESNAISFLDINEDDLKQILQLCNNSTRITNEARDYLITKINNTYGTNIPLSNEITFAIKNQYNEDITIQNQAKLILFHAGMDSTYGQIPKLESQVINKMLNEETYTNPNSKRGK